LNQRGTSTLSQEAFLSALPHTPAVVETQHVPKLQPRVQKCMFGERDAFQMCNMRQSG
jgi:hypothetical protein